MGHRVIVWEEMRPRGRSEPEIIDLYSCYLLHISALQRN